MSQLTLAFGMQSLNLELESDSLHLKLSRAQPSSEPCYTYTAKLTSKNIDNRLTFVFGSIQNLWKYISFYREKAILIDSSRVEMENKLLAKDYPMNGHLSPDKMEVELPISIKLIVLEGIETIFGLRGEMIIDSVERRLTKALQENEQLKQKLSEAQNHESKLQEIISEMKKTIDFMESERQRLIQQELPRKKVHTIDEREEGEHIINQYSNKENLNVNEKHYYDNPQNQTSNKNFEPSQPLFVQIGLTQQCAEECKVNEKPTENYHAPNENVFFLKKIEPQPKIDGTSNQKTVNVSSKHFNNEESFEQTDGNQSENFKKIKEFASKCFLLVGFTEKGQERNGYVCIVCSKAFKEVSYLEKHLLLRHSEISTSTEEMLGIKLIQYKKKKEMDMKLENAMKFYTAQK